uniref:Transporter n=1 Tax=Panagrellus redivivus TaxID=6233 RepID=A0A7E4V1Q8_PANRE
MDSHDDWRIALRQAIEHLAKQNATHKRFPEINNRTQEMDAMILNLRHLLSESETKAAQYHIKCFGYITETEKILAAKGISYTSRSTTPAINNLNESFQRQANWESQEATESQAEQNPYYFPYTSKWWRVLCFNSGKEAKSKQEAEHVRDLWNTQFEFFLSCLGFIVGVGNTLRFPSMVYQHGGGVFFIPYLTCLCVFGLPLVYMHLCIGQYAGLSASGAFWKMMPMASGIGWALVLLAIPVSIYYNIINAWSLYYFWYSIKSLFTAGDLPWIECHDDWVARFNCCGLYSDVSCYDNPYSMTSTEAFFYYQVLNRTLLANPDMGHVQSHLVIALAVAWIIVFLGVFKGIGSIGWAVTITATVPYFLLITLLLRGISLPGATEGIKFFLHPDMNKLWSISIWKSAAEQVFYSLGIDAGPLISMASFSRYRNNIYRDACLLVLIDTITSILCGMVIFSFIGFLATIQNKALTEVLKHDSLYLAFTAYPGVPSYMEWGPLWSALFFGMLAISALDAEFAWLEMIASSIMNQIDSKQKSLENRILVILCLCFFVLGIPLCMQGGIFIFHSIENLNANWNSFSLSLMQVVIVCYVYGVQNFLDDIGEMQRVEPETVIVTDSKIILGWMKVKRIFGPTGPYIKWSWCLFSPVILTALLMASVFSYDRVHFRATILPWRYEIVAWIAMVGPLFVVPFTCIYTIYEGYRKRKPLKACIDSSNWRYKPKEEEQKQPQHQISDNSDNMYMYIDPISRGPSAKTPRNFSHMDGNDDDNYHSAHRRIREWAEQSAKSEAVNTIELATIEEIQMTPRTPITPRKISSISRDSDSDDRPKGRLRDWERTNAIDLPERPPLVFDFRTPSGSDKSTEDIALFGPPPIPDGFENTRAVTVRMKPPNQNSRKISNFSDNIPSTKNVPQTSVVINRATPSISPKSDRVDRELTTERLGTVRHRESSESFADQQSIGSLSITPIDNVYARSLSSASDTQYLKPSHAKPVRLKRPKPIDFSNTLQTQASDKPKDQ